MVNPALLFLFVPSPPHPKQLAEPFFSSARVSTPTVEERPSRSRGPYPGRGGRLQCGSLAEQDQPGHRGLPRQQWKAHCPQVHAVSTHSPVQAPPRETPCLRAPSAAHAAR